MKYPIIIIIFASIIITPLLSMGAIGINDDGGQQAPIDTTHQAPVILSSLNGANLHFWIQHDHNPKILYDLWEILIFGDPGDLCKLKINGIEAFNDTMALNYLNLSFDATEINSATVMIQIGNRSYTFSTITILHWDIGMGSSGDATDLHGEYFKTDLNKARFWASVGATVLSVISIYITWSMLKFINSRKGVERL